MRASYMNLSQGSTCYRDWVELGEYLHVRRKKSFTTITITIIMTNKNKQQSEDKSLTFLSKHMQFRAPKYINGKLESPRMRYLLVGDE